MRNIAIIVTCTVTIISLWRMILNDRSFYAKIWSTVLRQVLILPFSSPHPYILQIPQMHVTLQAPILVPPTFCPDNWTLCTTYEILFFPVACATCITSQFLGALGLLILRIILLITVYRGFYVRRTTVLVLISLTHGVKTMR